MKIKSLQLKNFKRFTDLTLQDIPDNAKLVLLIGSNGSGKSSVFDAFERIATEKKEDGRAQYDLNNEYYSKDGLKDYFIIIKKNNNTSIIHNSYENKASVNNFYGRTSFRQIPRLTRRSLGSNFDIVKDTDRPKTYIDRDERFENDLEHIYGKLLREYFVSKDKSEVHEKIIDPINQAFKRIFNENPGTLLQLENIIPPLEGKVSEITFNKGNSFFQYNNLSAGEKEVFNILINLVAREEYYRDTIYFFDEIDLHLNTKLQYNFLKEIVENWIPSNCQFWTASHSLGFIQYAREYEDGIIFDFDDFDFDYPITLVPVPKDNLDVYEIAVGKEILPELFRDFTKIFVENTDADNYYSNLQIDNYIFIKRKDKKAIYDNIFGGNNLGLIDRDFLSEEDLSLLEKVYTNLRILKMYSVENYLFHPENLIEYCRKEKIPFNIEEYKKEVFKEKENIKHELFAKISDARQTYPFGKEISPADKSIQIRFSKSEQNREQIASITKEIDSQEFNTYYKHLPMKNYLTQLTIRKILPKTELSKTNWFKKQIEEIIKQK